MRFDGTRTRRQGSGVDDPPPSAPITTPPRALRSAELAELVGGLPLTEQLAPPPTPLDVESIDLLAHTTGDEPISDAPCAVRPLRHSSVRRRLH